MHKLLSLIVCFELLFALGASGAATNEAATTPSTNVVQSVGEESEYTEEELMEAAEGVLQKVLILGFIALIGAITIAGFALYGAYKMFGKQGIVVVIVILLFGLYLLGELLVFF